MENPKIPMNAPAIKTMISVKFNEFNESSIYAYCPKSNNKNDPEIPGNIIAQIAIIPEKNNTIRLWLAAIGFNPTNIYDKIIPIIVNMISFILISSNLVYNI